MSIVVDTTRAPGLLESSHNRFFATPQGRREEFPCVAFLYMRFMCCPPSNRFMEPLSNRCSPFCHKRLVNQVSRLLSTPSTSWDAINSNPLVVDLLARLHTTFHVVIAKPTLGVGHLAIYPYQDTFSLDPNRVLGDAQVYETLILATKGHNQLSH